MERLCPDEDFMLGFSFSGKVALAAIIARDGFQRIRADTFSQNVYVAFRVSHVRVF